MPRQRDILGYIRRTSLLYQIVCVIPISPQGVADFLRAAPKSGRTRRLKQPMLRQTLDLEHIGESLARFLKRGKGGPCNQKSHCCHDYPSFNVWQLSQNKHLSPFLDDKSERIE